MKLAIIIGTRPELIRLTCIIKTARQYFDVHLLHTGQNYDPHLKDVFLTEFGIDKCTMANWVGSDLGETVGNVIRESYRWLQKLQPDALLLLGDTNSCLSAYSAKRLKIPIFHIEAGNRCFDQNLPEEVNRSIIDHISDVNLCYTEHARRNLIAEGLKPQFTFVIGSPMPEVIASMCNQIKSSKALDDLNLLEKKYILVSAHREENVDNPDKLNQLIHSLESMQQYFQMPIIVSLHPRTKARLNGRTLSEQIRLCPPFKYSDYCCLQQRALFVASDSGTLTEESSILGFKAVLLRDSTEHPEGVDKGTIVLGTVNWSDLKRSIDLCLANAVPNIFEYNNVAQSVCNLISGYTPIVNKYIWFK